jgi:hypothetical protein
MGDKIIITDDEPKPEPQIIVVAAETKPIIEQVVTEKTTTVETRKE